MCAGAVAKVAEMSLAVVLRDAVALWRGSIAREGRQPLNGTAADARGGRQCRLTLEHRIFASVEWMCGLGTRVGRHCNGQKVGGKQWKGTGSACSARRW